MSACGSMQNMNILQKRSTYAQLVFRASCIHEIKNKLKTNELSFFLLYLNFYCFI